MTESKSVKSHGFAYCRADISVCPLSIGTQFGQARMPILPTSFHDGFSTSRRSLRFDVDPVLMHLSQAPQPRSQNLFDLGFVASRELRPDSIAHQPDGPLEQLNRGVEPLTDGKPPRPAHPVDVNGVRQGLDLTFHGFSLPHSRPIATP